MTPGVILTTLHSLRNLHTGQISFSVSLH